MDAFFVLIHSKGRSSSSRDQDNVLAREEANKKAKNRDELIKLQLRLSLLKSQNEKITQDLEEVKKENADILKENATLEKENEEQTKEIELVIQRI